MAARHRSRRRALQLLFEWDMRGGAIDAAIAHFYETLYSGESAGESSGESDALPPKRDKFMEELARGTVAHAAEIDKQIESKAANWRLERMPVVDRNVLRLAIYELREQATPAAVVIDEALELARQFSNDEAVPFINGILDALNKQNP